MILADTSVWVDHFRTGNTRLREHLAEGQVFTHPMVLGELACGNLPHRGETLALLRSLPCIPAASDEAVHLALDSRRLWGKGIGWIDAHLITATRIAGCRLWTLDKRLAGLAGD